MKRNEPDDFSDLVRQKLENYKIPIDSECWNEIEFRMKSRKRKIMPWLSGVAAIIAVMVCSIFFLFDGEEAKQNPARKAQRNVAVPSSLNQIDLLTEDSNAKTEDKEPHGILVASNRKAKKEPDINNIVQQIQNVLDTTTITIDNGILVASQNSPEDSVVVAIVTDSLPKEKVDDGREVKNQKTEPRKILLPKKERQNTWQLAASFSSSRNASLSGSNAPLYNFAGMASNGDVSDRPVFSEGVKTLTTEEFSDIEHNMPLSVGLTVRKDINDRFGIETGLMYTYLSSRFKKTEETIFRSKQELHYLGIPVNLVTYLWNDKRWNIYLTTGGMVEKGLQSVYTQDVYQNNSKMGDFSERSSIDGLQWSLNASIGASYNFYQGLGLYFEPRISYYFNNGQPVSIRTEKNAVFGLSGGLRYKF